jgi:hypothetical protein
MTKRNSKQLNLKIKRILYGIIQENYNKVVYKNLIFIRIIFEN